MRTARVPTLLMFVVAAFGVLVGCSRPEPMPEAVRAVRTITVQTGVASAPIEFSAEIQARVDTQLAFQVPGKLTRRNVEVGQVVRAGQVLAELDAADLRLGEQAAQAAVDAAVVQAAQTQSDLDRFTGLHAKGFISAAELESRTSAANAAAAQLEQARAQSKLQVNQAVYGRLLAPSDGVITAAHADAGMVVAAGQAVFRMAHAGPRDAVFTVPEQSVAALRSLMGVDGQLAVRLWGQPQDPLPATVREVAAVADPLTRTFRVRAELGHTAVDLGQTATVTLTHPARQGVIQLPLTALLQRGGQTLVWVFDPDQRTVRTQAVQVVDAVDNDALIVSSLSAGTEVVTAGVHVLTEGQQVTRLMTASVAASAASAR